MGGSRSKTWCSFASLSQHIIVSKFNKSRANSTFSHLPARFPPSPLLSPPSVLASNVKRNNQIQPIFMYGGLANPLPRRFRVLTADFARNEGTFHNSLFYTDLKRRREGPRAEGMGYKMHHALCGWEDKGQQTRRSFTCFAFSHGHTTHKRRFSRVGWFLRRPLSKSLHSNARMKSSLSS